MKDKGGSVEGGSVEGEVLHFKRVTWDMKCCSELAPRLWGPTTLSFDHKEDPLSISGLHKLLLGLAMCWTGSGCPIRALYWAQRLWETISRALVRCLAKVVLIMFLHNPYHPSALSRRTSWRLFDGINGQWSPIPKPSEYLIWSTETSNRGVRKRPSICVRLDEPLWTASCHRIMVSWVSWWNLIESLHVSKPPPPFIAGLNGRWQGLTAPLVHFRPPIGLRLSPGNSWAIIEK